LKTGNWHSFKYRYESCSALKYTETFDLFGEQNRLLNVIVKL